MTIRITVDGKKCRIVESLGYVHDIGARACIVLDDDEVKTAISAGRGVWRFWTAQDRAKPLVDAQRRKETPAG